MELGEVYVKIGADIVPLEKALGKARSVTKKTGEQMGAQMKAVGKKMAIVGVAITAAFALTVKSAMSFQKQLAQVSTMLDESAMKIMPKYKKGLLDMSMAFGESTDTLSRGLYDILSASIPPAKALDVLAVAAKAATAGITDTGVAADAITTILNSYGFAAEDAGKVSDILFATVKRGKLTFNELAPAIGKSAALAATAGLSFEDLTAMIATLTRAGIRTDEAMTSVNGVLRAFLKPTDDAKEAAKEFGLTLDTNTLKTIGMTGVMELLKDATAEQLAVIFPNIRALKGMAALLGDMEGHTKDYALMLSSAGLTQEAFAKQSATLSFKLEQAKKAINVLAVTIGDILMPTVEKIIAYVITLVSKIKEWAEANKPLTEKIVKWAAALGLVLAVLGPILIILPGLIAALGLLKVAFIPFLIGGAIIAGVIALANAFNKLDEAMYLTSETLDKMTLAEIDAAIAKLTERASEYQEAWYKAREGLWGWEEDRQIAVKAIEEIEGQIAILIKRREELTKTEEEGAEVTEGLIEIDKAMAAQQEALNKILEEYAEGLSDIPEEIEEVLKGSALLSAQVSLLKTEYENSNKTLEDTQEYYKSMTELLERYIEQLKIEIKNEKESTPTWFAKNEELLKAVGLYEEVKEAIEELNKVQDLQLTGLELTRAKLELLELRYQEIEKGVGYYKEKLQLLREEHELLVKNLDEVIEKYGEGTEEYYKAKAAIIAIENEMKKWWKEIDKGEKTVDEFARSFADKMLKMKLAAEGFGKTADTSWEKWKEFFTNLASKYESTLSIIQNGILSFVSSFESALTGAITSLLTMAETNAKIKEEIAKEEEKYKEEMAKLQEEYNAAVMAGDNEAAQNALDKMDDIKEKHEEVIEGMEGEQVTFQSVWKTFWTNLKTAAINALAEIIAKMLILKGLMLLFGWLGIPLSWLSMEKGGKAGYKKGGKVEGYQAGGMGTDTVPAMLTPGEYVISKPMVDFIKRTGAVTSDLVSAIGSGARTPVPAFATGGGVSNPISNTYNQQRSYSNPINIQPGAIQIVTPKFGEDDAQEMFRLIERQAKMRGLALGRV